MIKRLALLAFLATPLLAHAQAPEDAAVAAAPTPSVPLVTFDITGTFPANAPTTKMTAPNAAFYLEFSVPQFVPETPPDRPANFGCTAYGATFVFNGEVFHPPVGSYGYAASAGNIESLNFVTRNGAIGLSSVPAYHTPYLSNRLYIGTTPTLKATFLTGDLGAGTNWYFYFTPKGSNAPYSVPINLTDVTGRLVLPPARPLTTR